MPVVVFGFRSNGRSRGREIFLFPLLQFLSSDLHYAGGGARLCAAPGFEALGLRLTDPGLPLLGVTLEDRQFARRDIEASCDAA